MLPRITNIMWTIPAKNYNKIWFLTRITIKHYHDLDDRQILQRKTFLFWYAL